MQAYPHPQPGPAPMMPPKPKAPGIVKALGITLCVANGLVIVNCLFGFASALFMPSLYANMGMGAEVVSAMEETMQWSLITNGASLIAAAISLFGAIALLKAKPNAPTLLYAGYGVWFVTMVVMTVILVAVLMPLQMEMQAAMMNSTPGGGGAQGDAMQGLMEDLATPIAIVASVFYFAVWGALLGWTVWVLKKDRTKAWLAGKLEPAVDWSQYHQPSQGMQPGAPQPYPNQPPPAGPVPGAAAPPPQPPPTSG